MTIDQSDTIPVNPGTDNKKTSIIISVTNRDLLKESKHGGNTYDDVITTLVNFYRVSTGKVIVE